MKIGVLYLLRGRLCGRHKHSTRTANLTKLMRTVRNLAGATAEFKVMHETTIEVIDKVGDGSDNTFDAITFPACCIQFTDRSGAVWKKCKN